MASVYESTGCSPALKEREQFVTSSEQSRTFQASPVQLQLWKHSGRGTDSGFVQLVLALDAAGAAAARGAVVAAVRRHESLRSTLVALPGGEPGLVVHEMGPRLRTVAAASEEEAFASRAREAARLDPLAGPVFGALLLTGPGERKELILTAHPAFADRESLRRVAAEVLSPAVPGVNAAPLQYPDFAAWHRDLLADAEGSGERAAWARQLSGLSEIPAPPVSAPGAALGGTVGGSLRAEHELGELVDAFAAEHLVPSALVLAGLGALACWRFHGEQDLVVELAMPARIEGSDGAVGPYERLVPVPGRIAAGEPAADFLLRFAADAAQRAERVDYLDPAVLDSVPGLGWYVVRVDEAPAAFDVGRIVAEDASAHHPVQLEFHRDGDGLELRLRAAGAVVPNPGAFLRHLLTLARAALDRPADPVGELRSLSDDECAGLVALGRGPVSEAAAAPVHEAFAAQAARTPDAVAVTDGVRELTYRELDERSDRAARLLTRLRVRPGDRVVLSLEREPELLVALLGVLKSGAVFVPVDPAYPRGRMALVLEDTGARVLMCAAARAGELSTSAEIVEVGRDWLSEPDADAVSRGDRPVTDPSAPAYVLYTSGSTGSPCGVLVPHRGLANYAAWSADAYAMADGSGVLAHSSISFDFTLTTLISPLLVGQRVILIPESVGSLSAVAAALRSWRELSVVKLTPTHLEVLGQLLTADDIAGAVRTLVVGGEALTGHATALFRSVGTRVVNEYGPTETVVGSTAYVLASDAPEPAAVPIGRPIANTAVHLLDPRGRLVPDGAVGEIHIAGDGVSLGYLGDPERTAARFLPADDMTGGADALMYRTGDLARRRDGELEYLGRADGQLNVQGMRVEPAEIEAAMLACPGVAQAVCVVRRDVDQGKSSPLAGTPTLVGYVVGARGATAPNAEALARTCRERLPEQVVPKAFVLLDALPLTVNGKLDRSALPRPDLSARPGADYAAPRTDTEEILAGSIATVLGLDQVGIDDNYFILGGDSIRSVMVTSRAQGRGVDVEVADLHADPTVRRLAERLAARGDRSTPVRTAPFSLISAADRVRIPENVEDAFPLNLLQEGMIFHRDFAEKSAVYHAIASLRLQAPYEHDVMRMAVNQLVERHPMLRTSFDMTSFSRPLQLVHTEFGSPLHLEDLRELPEAEREERVRGWVAAEKARGFELYEFPLIRFMVQRLTDQEWQFTYGFHHEIVDGWSEALMITELFSQYFSVVYDEPISVKSPSSTMRDAVALELEALEDKANFQFWDRYLAGATMMRLPRFGKGIVADKGAREIVRIEVPVNVELSERLKRIAQDNAVPLKNVLMAAHMVVMSTYGGNADTLTYTVSNGRPESADGSTAVGLFVNSLALRVPMPGGTWAGLIAAGLESERASIPYRRLPMAELKRHQGSEPLAETLFFFTNYHVFDVLNRWVRRGVSHVATDLYGESTFPFCAINRLNRETGHLEIRLEYDSLQFSAELMDGVRDCYSQVLDAMSADPDGRYDLQSFAPAGQRRALGELARAQRPSTACSQCLHELFEQQAAATPNAVALESCDGLLTYRQLDRRADWLASLLLSWEPGRVGPERIVGVVAERSAEQIIAMLAVLKAGAAYLPLDPALPADRIDAILADAHCELVLSQRRLAANLSAGVTVIELDTGLRSLEALPARKPTTLVRPSNAAYVIYTSGSTGEPKGVVVEHRNAVASTLARHAGYTGEPERFLLLSSFAFDSSVAGIFWTLTRGGTLILPREGLQREPAALIGLAAQRRPTHTLGIPSLLRMLLDQSAEGDLDSLRTVISAGEACPADLAARFTERVSGVVFANEYGPTEATVWATAWCSRPEEPLGLDDLLQVPIGTPVGGASVAVLDHNGQLAPVGVGGHLHIGGTGVARGYLGKPAATAAGFRPDRFAAWPGARAYATGDFGRMLPEGVLEFQGRGDHQVKIQGFRVELGAIEVLLEAHPAIRRAVVAARGEQGGARVLVGYVVPSGEGAVDTGEVRQYVRDHLPTYMVPSAVVIVESLPLTATGKVDRAALAAVCSGALGGADYIAPRDVREEVLAAIWCKVLSVERVGVNESFFDLGGESLFAMEVIAATNKTFGTALPVRQLFEAPTVGGLAAEVGRVLAAEAVAAAVGDAT